MSVTAEPEVYFDPYDVDINADPYPTYTRLREEARALLSSGGSGLPRLGHAWSCSTDRVGPLTSGLS